MSPILGENVPLQIYKDGEYTDYACITDCSLEFNTDTKETRTLGDGFHRKIRGQRLSFQVSGNGLIELQQVSPVAFYLLQNYHQQMIPVQFRMLFEDPVSTLIKVVEGTALITSFTTTAGSTGFATASFVMDGDGAVSISDSAIGCSATIGSITIGAGDPDIGANASVNYTGVSGAARLEYSVDGGARETLFSPAASGFFYLFGLGDGPHTIDVWAVCENGIDGEMNSQVFEVSGGEPGPTCAVPGVPALVSYESNLATVEWDASVSAPANGYHWELTFVSTGNLAQEADTIDTSATFFALEGVEYRFRVKSLCEAGVNESSYVELLFTPSAVPACNVPGAPVMSSITGTSATATWTAPSPAPANGYAWEVLQGVTVVDSGTTSGLSVNLVGLTAGTSYTFRVKSVCGVGSESGYNSTGFDTSGDSNIDWNLDESAGNGSLQIRRNGLTVVNVTTGQTGSFTAGAGDFIQIFFTAGGSGDLNVDDVTAGTIIISITGSGSINDSFNVTSAHNYSINAIVTS